MLNKDQTKGLLAAQNWWHSNEPCMVLDGAGGTGKTYLIKQMLNTLTRCSPILLAPTNEAVSQIREKVENNKYIYKTIHSALGIAPTVNDHELKFEQIALPALWDDINLAIIDESSMINEDILKLLLCIKVKILFIGHKSQLPPVNKKRLTTDLCISPVFEQDFPTTTLKIPMRNTGALWDFNNYLEELIYNKERTIPNTFDIKKSVLTEIMNTSETEENLLNGNLKLALWTNAGVDRCNNKIRKILHGETAKKYLYLPNDLIILTSPLTAIDNLERFSDSELKQVMGNNQLPTLYSNAKATVLACVEVVVKLNKYLVLDCYKIYVKCEGIQYTFYSLKYPNDRQRMEDYYNHIAWNYKDKKAKTTAFRQKHFILSCFAQVKHYFAATSHRLQGTSIDKVIVFNNDINKNMCRVEAAKCRYVACSRAINELYFYRGL